MLIMETDSVDVTDETKKSEDNIEEPVKQKKVKQFYAKEFRQNLQDDNKLEALQQFLKLCTGNKKASCILQYLEGGGSCLELLQLIDMDRTLPPTVIFEIVANILLEISANLPQQHLAAYEASRYLLNTYLALINKMLGLSSNAKERKVALKLLTAVVIFSPNLAKDVLAQVNFNPTNLELLTKHTGTKDGVRDAFIHFLTSFLVDGYYLSTSILLEKRGLLTSIINGLQFDSADSVCLVLTALKNNVLEDVYVSKTVKMKTFSTRVVKDIVTLYNWKGPESFDPKRKNNRKNIVTVNEHEKSKVSECVHDFLLILCTSHKFGVIFRDPLLGLGSKLQNSLIYTVLESLERPWEHSYAGELVSKICAACPDLTKTLWLNLKRMLEPRSTTRWLLTLNFVKNLLNELQPSCIEASAKLLSPYQVAQIIQMLIAPTQILKTLIPNNQVFEKKTIKYHILLLLSHVLRSVQGYVRAAENWFNAENFTLLKQLVNDHILRNFPTGSIVIEDCEKIESETYEYIKKIGTFDYLNVVFDLLHLYQNINPQLLDTLSNNIDVQRLLQEVKEMNEGSAQEKSSALIVKIIRFFLCYDRNLFVPKSKAFAFSVNFMLEFYYNTRDVDTYDTLKITLENTGVFEGSEAEISVWINSIFDLKRFDENVSYFLVQILKMTVKKSVQYLSEFMDIRVKLNDNSIHADFDEILNNLVNHSSKDFVKAGVHHVNLSPLILGALEYLSESDANKGVKCYMNFALLNLLHMQTSPYVLIDIVTSKICDAISQDTLSYILSWVSYDELVTLPKVKGRLDMLPKLSDAIVTGNIDRFIKDNKINFTCYNDQILHLLQMAVFYVANLAVLKKLTQQHVENCLKMVKYALENDEFNNKQIIDTIFSHSVLLQFFSPMHLNKEDTQGYCSYFMLDIVKYLKELKHGTFDTVVKDFRAKLFRSLLKILSNLTIKETIVEIVTVFDLDLQHCIELLQCVSDLKPRTSLLAEGTLVPIYNLTVYCLRRSADLSSTFFELQPLGQETIEALAEFLCLLNCRSEHFDTSALALSLSKYLNLLPHCLEYVGIELFESVLSKTEYCPANTSLMVLLLDRKPELLDCVTENVSKICAKKALTLPLLEVVVKYDDSKILKSIYENFEPSIVKALQKPQKAGQHFEKHYKAVAVLLNCFYPLESCNTYIDKIHKYECMEPFHTYLLEVIFNKAIFTAENFSEKPLNNSILTMIHLCMNVLKKKTKTDADWVKIDEVVEIFVKYLQKIVACNTAVAVSYEQVSQTETFKLFCKFCLKFGLSGRATLLKVLTALLKFLNLDENGARLLMDMIISHSEFLTVILNEDSNCKTELLSLILGLCQRWTAIMQRSHLPILLSAYHASASRSDRILLLILKMFENIPAQTNFYDFKPFLWGPSAANHYSVRSDIQRTLWRQPRTSSILEILQDKWVLSTVKNYWLNLSLESENLSVSLNEDIAKTVYDLSFLLPLFALILTPENSVQTYRFTRSGALSLTIVALSSEDKDVRAAACLVLSRFYHHLEMRLSGKDNVLWLRFVEAVCRGTGVIKDFKLNNFAAIFLARMSLILTQPIHIMYVPLSQYLGAKSALDFTAIPELYTFLHSPDINYKEHRSFILAILRDGLRTTNDFNVAFRSMAFKLIMELFTSHFSDLETQTLILEIFRSASKITLGYKLLCSSYGFLSWIHEVVHQFTYTQYTLFPIVFDIFLHTVELSNDTNSSDFSTVALTLSHIIDNVNIYNFNEHVLTQLLRTIILIFDQYPEFLTETRLKRLISIINCKECEYLLRYGKKYVNFDSSFNHNKDKHYCIKFLTLKWISSKM